MVFLLTWVFACSLFLGLFFIQLCFVLIAVLPFGFCLCGVCYVCFFVCDCLLVRLSLVWVVFGRFRLLGGFCFCFFGVGFLFWCVFCVVLFGVLFYFFVLFGFFGFVCVWFGVLFGGFVFNIGAVAAGVGGYWGNEAWGLWLCTFGLFVCVVGFVWFGFLVFMVVVSCGVVWLYIL